MPGLVRFGNAAAVGGIVLVLLVGFVLQFALGELPCPLCNLQRVGFALCAFGFLLNLRFGPQKLHYGLVLLSALFGLTASGRQILLHIVPGTGAYGSAILGLHFYTWAHLLFLAVIAGTAVLMILSGGRADHDWTDAQAASRFSGLYRLAAYTLIAVTLISAVISFAQCGPIECADDPERYWLLKYFS